MHTITGIFSFYTIEDIIRRVRYGWYTFYFSPEWRSTVLIDWTFLNHCASTSYLKQYKSTGNSWCMRSIHLVCRTLNRQVGIRLKTISINALVAWRTMIESWKNMDRCRKFEKWKRYNKHDSPVFSLWGYYPAHVQYGTCAYNEYKWKLKRVTMARSADILTRCSQSTIYWNGIKKRTRIMKRCKISPSSVMKKYMILLMTTTQS
jgi:hypothetical protein